MPQSFSRPARQMHLVAALLLALIGPACQSKVNDVVVDPPRTELERAFAINGNGSVTLGWAPIVAAPVPFDTAAIAASGSMEIHRSSDPDFVAYRRTLRAVVPARSAFYVDTALANGATYYYRLVPVGSPPSGILQYGVPSEVLIGRPYDYAGIAAIDYDEHIQRIFTSGCAVHGCHVGESNHPSGVLRKSADHAKAQFSLRSWEDLMAGSQHGAVVIPFKAMKSHLVFHLNDDTLVSPVSTPHMPLPGFQLPAEQIATLIRWVNGGAYNASGAVAFSVHPQGEVLVTGQAEDLVAVVDIATGLVSRYVQAGTENVFTQPPQAPHNIAVDKARGVYYVNLVGNGKLLKFRLSDNALLGELSGLASPTQVALSRSGDTGYVAQFVPGRNAVRLVRTSTMELLDSISVLNLDRPHGAQITPDGAELWVTGNSSDNIMVANLADRTTELIQLNNQPPGEGFQLLPYQTVMTPDNRFVYVSCQQSNEVRVVDRATKSVVKAIPVGIRPLILAISPDGRFVYSANRNSNDVTVIRTSDNTVIATIPDVGPQPHGIDLSADGKFAYVSCENIVSLIPPHHPTTGSKRPGFLTVIDLTRNAVVKQIEVGAFASGVAVVQ